MAYKSEHITYGKTPQDRDGVWFAPIGTEISKNPFEIPAAEAIGLGHVSDEGDTETPGYGDVESIKDQNGTPVKLTNGDYEPSHSFALMQSGNDYEVDKVVYGEENVIGTAEKYRVNKNNNNKSVGMIIVDHKFDNGARERIIYSNATIRLSDDIQNNANDVRLLPVTVTPAMDPETGNVGVSYKQAKAEVAQG